MSPVSHPACRSYLRGRISRPAARILLQRPPQRKISLVWAPAHSSLRGNVMAHTTARELAYRAPRDDWLQATHPLVTYQSITQHYKLSRQEYPPAHPSLTKEQEHKLRLLQTNTFPHLSKLHAINPTLYSATCSHCGEICTLYHMVWACQKNPNVRPIPNPSYEQWERELASSSSETQLRLVERAEKAASSNGILK